VHLTPSEEEVLNVLAMARRPLSSWDIVYRVYGEKPPEHARIWIGQLVRSLVKKTSRRNSKRQPRVFYSGRQGTKPMEVWVEQ
jgi:hypothetical protein